MCIIHTFLCFAACPGGLCFIVHTIPRLCFCLADAAKRAGSGKSATGLFLILPSNPSQNFIYANNPPFWRVICIWRARGDYVLLFILSRAFAFVSPMLQSEPGREKVPPAFFLSSLRIPLRTSYMQITRLFGGLFAYGVPGGIRTLDLLIRSQTLYPAELRAHINFSALSF